MKSLEQEIMAELDQVEARLSTEIDENQIRQQEFGKALESVARVHDIKQAPGAVLAQETMRELQARGWDPQEFKADLASVEAKDLTKFQHVVNAASSGLAQLGSAVIGSFDPEAGLRMSQEIAAKNPLNPDYQDSFLLTDLPSAAGSMIPTLAMGALSGGAALPSSFGAIAGAGGARLNAYRQNASADQTAVSMLAGFGLGALEGLPIGNAITRFAKGPGAKGVGRVLFKALTNDKSISLLKRVTTHGLSEAIEEGAQEFVSSFGQAAVDKMIGLYHESLWDAFKDAARQGAAGAVLGGAVGGAIGAKAPHPIEVLVDQLERSGFDNKNKNTVISAVSDVLSSDELVPAELDGLTRNEFVRGLMESYQLDTARVDAVMEIVDRFTAYWGKVNNREPGEWFGTIAEIKRMKQEEFEKQVKDGEVLSEAEMLRQETQSGKAKGVVRDRFMKVMGGNLYSGDLGVIAAKELIQNSVDAVRMKITEDPNAKNTDIEMSVSTKEKSISIVDNGVGMLPDVVKNEFVDPGGSLKGEEATGGFGIAKIAIFGNAMDRVDGQPDPIQVVSVARDPKTGKLWKTTLKGGASDWFNEGFDVVAQDITGEDVPTGTEIFIQLRPDVEMQEYKIADYLAGLTRNSQLPFGINVLIDGTEITQPRQPSNQIKKTKIPGATMEVYTSGNSGGKGSYIYYTVLNSGLVQFQDSVYVGQPIPTPQNLVVNIVPDSKPDQPNYPFRPDREGLREQAKQAVNKFISEEFAIAAMQAEKNRYRTAFNNASIITGTGYVVIDGRENADTKLSERIAKKPYVKKLAQVIDYITDKIVKRMKEFNPVYSRGKFFALSVDPGQYGYNLDGQAVGEVGLFIAMNPWAHVADLSGKGQSQGDPSYLTKAVTLRGYSPDLEDIMTAVDSLVLTGRYYFLLDHTDGSTYDGFLTHDNKSEFAEALTKFKTGKEIYSFRIRPEEGLTNDNDIHFQSPRMELLKLKPIMDILSFDGKIKVTLEVTPGEILEFTPSFSPDKDAGLENTYAILDVLLETLESDGESTQGVLTVYNLDKVEKVTKSDSDTSLDLAEEILSTVIHEVVHNVERSHNERYAGELTSAFAKTIRLHPDLLSRLYNVLKESENELRSDATDIQNSTGGKNIFKDVSAGYDPKSQGSQGSEGSSQRGEETRGERGGSVQGREQVSQDASAKGNPRVLRQQAGSTQLPYRIEKTGNDRILHVNDVLSSQDIRHIVNEINGAGFWKMNVKNPETGKVDEIYYPKPWDVESASTKIKNASAKSIYGKDLTTMTNDELNKAVEAAEAEFAKNDVPQTELDKKIKEVELADKTPRTKTAGDSYPLLQERAMQGAPEYVFHTTEVPSNNTPFAPLTHFGGIKSHFFFSRWSNPGARTYKIKLNVKNPFPILDDLSGHELTDIISQEPVKDALGKTHLDAIRVIRAMERNGSAEDGSAQKYMIQVFEKMGYDGFVYVNRLEGVGELSWMNFHPEQVQRIGTGEQVLFQKASPIAQAMWDGLQDPNQDLSKASPFFKNLKALYDKGQIKSAGDVQGLISAQAKGKKGERAKPAQAPVAETKVETPKTPEPKVAEPKVSVTKGAVEFLPDGRAILYAFEHADVSTVMHELVHVWRRQMPEQVLRRLANALGVDDHRKWSVDDEEKVARTFERWLRQGKVDIPGLENTFKSFKGWMEKIYPKVKGSEIDVSLTKDVKDFFEGVLQYKPEDVKPIQGKKSPTPKIVRQANYLRQEGEKVKLEQGRPSASSRLHALVDISAMVTNIPAGQKLVELADEIDTTRKSYRALAENPSVVGKSLTSVMKSLTSEQRAWLASPVEGAEHISKFRALIEEDQGHSVKIPEKWTQAQDAVDIARAIQEVFADLAVSAGVLTRTEKGIEPFKMSEFGRVMRSMTEQGIELMLAKDTVEGKEFIQQIAELNPDMKLKDLQFEVRKIHEGLQRSHARMLEGVRKIPVFPDFVTIGGKRIQVLETNPVRLLEKAADQQAQYIATTKVSGQGLIEDKGIATLRMIAKALGVSPTNTSEDIIYRLTRNGVPDTPELRKLTHKQLRKLAKDIGVPASPDRVEHLNNILSVTDANKMSKRDLKALQRAARKVGGIDLSLTANELVEALRVRAFTVYPDKLEALRKQFISEGGKAEDFDQIANLAQGLPNWRFSQALIPRAIRAMAGISSALQTSTASVLNLSQTAQLVPWYTGWGNFSSALADTMSDYENTKAQGVLTGAFRTDVYEYDVEEGRRLESIARIVRNSMATGTGLKFLSDLNNIITAKAFINLANDWKAGKFGSQDVVKAQNLRLTKEEISEVQNGKMSEATFNKIVQNGVSVTQFVTESRHRQGWLTQNPWARIAFPLQSFSTGTMRETIRAVDMMKKAVKTKKPEDLLAAGMRLKGLVIRGTLIGMGNILLKEALLRRPREEDEKLWEKTLGGFVDSQFFGPTTMLMSGYFWNAGTIDQSITALSPSLRAASDGISVFTNTMFQVLSKADPSFKSMITGRYGRLGPIRQAAEVSMRHIPALRALYRWYENYAYPQADKFDRARRLYFKFEDETNPKWGKMSGQLNPDYLPVFEAIRRGDTEGAMKAAGEYYKTKAESKEDLERAVQNLRASLLGRRPIPLSQSRILEFVKWLPAERREEVFKLNQQYQNMVDLVAP